MNADDVINIDYAEEICANVSVNSITTSTVASTISDKGDFFEDFFNGIGDWLGRRKKRSVSVHDECLENELDLQDFCNYLHQVTGNSEEEFDFGSWFLDNVFGASGRKKRSTCNCNDGYSTIGDQQGTQYQEQEQGGGGGGAGGGKGGGSGGFVWDNFYEYDSTIMFIICNNYVITFRGSVDDIETTTGIEFYDEYGNIIGRFTTQSTTRLQTLQTSNPTERNSGSKTVMIGLEAIVVTFCTRFLFSYFKI